MTPTSLPLRSSEEAVCKSCGASFLRSKFNPYLDQCPGCRGSSPPQWKDPHRMCPACLDAVSSMDPVSPPDGFVCLSCGRDYSLVARPDSGSFLEGSLWSSSGRVFMGGRCVGVAVRST